MLLNGVNRSAEKLVQRVQPYEREEREDRRGS
jgi:hypothetical protein